MLLRCLTEDGRESEDAITNQKLGFALKKILSDPAAYGFVTERSTFSSSANPFSSDVQGLSSVFIERLTSMLRPPPPGFIPNDRTELIDSLSEGDSCQLFI